jgi:hypothetical protein
MAKELALYLRGRIGYFGEYQTPSVPQSLEEKSGHGADCGR